MTTTTPTVIPTAADQAAVASLPGRIVAAWAGYDADDFAAVFTADGTMILPGMFVTGRDAIRSVMAQGFTGQYRGTRVTGQPIGLTFLSADVAILLTLGGVLLPGETEVADERTIRASWVAVKRDGEWQLAAYQNSPA